MQLVNKYAVALVASLAALGEAEHQGLHARVFNPRGYNGTFPTSHSIATSTPLQSTSVIVSSPVSSSKVISTPVSTPLTSAISSGAEQSGSASTTELTMTYTVGTGTSTSVITTTIYNTATDEHTVYAVSVSARGRPSIVRLTVSD